MEWMDKQDGMDGQARRKGWTSKMEWMDEPRRNGWTSKGGMDSRRNGWMSRGGMDRRAKTEWMDNGQAETKWIDKPQARETAK
jgi:hypothetical protein